MIMGRPRKIVADTLAAEDGEMTIVAPLTEEELDATEAEELIEEPAAEEVPVPESTLLEMQAGAAAVRRYQAMADLAAAQTAESKE